VAQLFSLGVARAFFCIFRLIIWKFACHIEYMKHFILAFAVLIIAGSFALFASLVQPWDNAKPPTLSLPAAYEVATTALGSATNEFHCISASIYSDAVVSPHGGWLFTFCSTNTPPTSKYVTVEFGGKFHVEDTLTRLE